jgi:hypothetical protein
MKLRFGTALLMFLSGYFPLALIFIIKDLDPASYLPMHPRTAGVVAAVAVSSCVVMLLAAARIGDGLPVRVTRVANKSGDMFTYTIPYMISFYNFNLGDWRTLLSLFVFMTLMFALAYRTQNVFINPVLALAGYGLYDCQFAEGRRERQALLLSRHAFRAGDTCVVQRISAFVFFVTSVTHAEDSQP